MERWAAVRPGQCDSEVVVRRAEHDNLPPGFIETSHFQPRSQSRANKRREQSLGAGFLLRPKATAEGRAAGATRSQDRRRATGSHGSRLLCGGSREKLDILL